jgi:hypothetical protein
MDSQPFAADLIRLSEELGVGRNDQAAVLNDGAPLASVRNAIYGLTTERED